MYGRIATKLLHQTSWGAICARHQRYVALSLSKNASSSAGLSEEELVDRIVRVDHAGEVGADKIYEGQLAVLRNTPVGPLIQEMWDEEKEHRETFEKLIVEHRVRPTALLPLWNIAGFVLGAGTAVLGKEAAMACTVAVEETIGEHYNDQIRQLIEIDPEKYKDLLQTLKKFRDDELHHLDTGLEHDALKAPFYDAMSTIIKTGCRTAIWLSERV
ncbi:5-demethoxyubiquinone hydroxylase, mitochondrial [Holothuria leucospilota]|uniref:5-demethoxyubiquinone hydroxylase, mitochondrial n=1 Tax=Holothuria leucospilota TaxID=206669 RepID=A0A9Q1C1I5_HOLLE|nr:5-demethoxyubiquinone hydroxylase, mitochondrial [Holothuria leucospilota]